MDGASIAIVVILLVIAGALFASYMKWGRHEPKERQGPQYVWLAIIGSSNAESPEGAYRAAYLLLTAGLRMELEMIEVFIEKGRGGGRPRVVDSLTYSTAAFGPHRNAIRSIQDFGRYAPYRDDRMMKLFVHPEDVDESVRLLQKAGLTVEVHPLGQLGHPLRHFGH